VHSLNFGVGGELQNAPHVFATLGLLIDNGGGANSGDSVDAGDGGFSGVGTTGDSTGGRLAVAGASVRYLRMGAASVRDGAGLRALLRREFSETVTGPGTGAPLEVEVEPWRALSALKVRLLYAGVLCA
jgi:hypothetical protein